MVGVELQMILSFMAKVNKSMISAYSTSLTQQGTTTYGSTQMEPLPGVFDMLKYFERILPLVESP